MITEPIALDKSLNTTDQNPKNLADVVQKGLNDIKNAIGGGGGGGGHTIVDSDGQDMPQEDAMQFADAFVSDDSLNGRTVIENIKEHTTASDYENATEDGIHVIDDGNDVPIGASSEDYEEAEAGAHTTVSALLDELYSKIDFTKISKSSIFERIETNGSKYIFTIQQITNSNVIIATLSVVSSTRTSGTTWHVRSSGSKSYDAVFGNTPTDDSGTELTEHTKFRLYYGTSSTVINLKTSADYCIMSDGETSVESAIAPSGYSTDGLTFTDCTWVNGGYFKIGKMAVLNIRVKVTASSSVTKAYINLPNKITPSTTLIGLTAQQSTDDLPPIFSVISIGKIFMKNTTDNKDYVISGAWLA